ncbi:hypothetical protein M3T53_02525 [Actinomyces sp. B33]|uniref:hypothetical protein n=1 Tax=Actinomyces sp. B33 TaxID=2942131 RepID=UPI002341DC77|nr:hypothetical protein [Actinomyces sp. B33]MDC4232590.1 hypothetical protein [Actinomyces sp. B33]
MSTPFSSPNPQPQGPDGADPASSAWDPQPGADPHAQAGGDRVDDQPAPEAASYDQSSYSQAAPQPDGQWEYGQAGQGQPMYGQTAYGQAPYYGAVPMMADAQKLQSNATICLVLGILGLVALGPVGSIPAWLWGNSIEQQAQAAGLPPALVSNARIGKILGIVGTILWAVIIVLVVIFFIAVLGVLATVG